MITVDKINIIQNGKNKIMSMSEKKLDTSDHAFLRARSLASDIRDSEDNLSGPTRSSRSSILTGADGIIYDIIEQRFQAKDLLIQTSLKAR